jgi:group I intron endonuclease
MDSTSSVIVLDVIPSAQPTYSYYLSAIDIPSLSAYVDFTISGIYVTTITPMMYITYVTTCKINNKIYVGQHSLLSKKKMYLGSGILIARAIKKYGSENFYREIIEYNTVVNIDDRETYWIAALSATDPMIGYNIAKGGRDGSTGLKRSKEQIQKNKGHKDRKHTEGTKIKIGIYSAQHNWASKFTYILSNNQHIWDVFDKVERRNISMRFNHHKSNIIVYKGITIERKLKDNIHEAYKNYINPRLGKHPSEETNRKNSESNKGRACWCKGMPKPQETKDKISKTLTGKPPTNYKFYYILSNGEDFWNFYNRLQRFNINRKINRHIQAGDLSNTIIYKGITITRRLKNPSSLPPVTLNLKESIT